MKKAHSGNKQSKEKGITKLEKRKAATPKKQRKKEQKNEEAERPEEKTLEVGKGEQDRWRKSRGGSEDRTTKGETLTKEKIREGQRAKGVSLGKDKDEGKERAVQPASDEPLRRRQKGFWEGGKM